MRLARWIGLFVAAAVVTPAPAAAAPVATKIRVGDHPGYVRVVVDFRGTLPTPTERVEAVDPDPFGDGRVLIRVTRSGVRTTAAAVTSNGLRASVQQGTGRITLRAQATTGRRFKFASYRILHGPDRLVLDLWKSAPPVPAAEIRNDPSGCLRLTRVATSGRTIEASGRERNLFEHSFVVQLRAANGRVLVQRALTGDPWRVRIRVPAGTPRQAGTLEAAAFSARDGALNCLVQVRVTL
jgi:hypothetical protein